MQSVWGSEAYKNLSVPALTADYNDKMGGVDIADQRRTYYATQLKVARNWMPLFFWLLHTTVINAYIIGHELYGKHWAYKKHLRWKWHEDLAWELVQEGFHELNPQQAQEQAPYPNPPGPSQATGTSRPATQATPLGNTKNSRQHGYISKYYELPLCRKQVGRHILKHMGKERLCVFCCYLKSSLISSEARTRLLSHPQAPRFNKISQSSYQCMHCQLYLCKDFCFSEVHNL